MADMVKGCLLFVVVDTECGGCGGLGRQWMAVDDVVKGYLPLPLPSPSSSWSKGMMIDDSDSGGTPIFGVPNSPEDAEFLGKVLRTFNFTPL